MIRILFFLCLLLAAGSLRAACVGDNLIAALPEDQRAVLDGMVAQHPYPEGNLWRAEKAGSTVHVVGTVHIPDHRLGPVLDKVAPLVEAADILILEASSAMQLEMQQRMAEDPGIAFLTEGPTLIDLLGDEAWEQLAEDLRARGVPPFVASKFRPWLLAMTLSIPRCALEAMASGDKGLDGRLEAEAEASGTPIATLDDLDAIIRLLGAGPMEQQIDTLRIMLMTDQDQEAMFATTLDSYFSGRHRQLWEFSRLTTRNSGLADPDATFDAFEDSLLIGRNRDWERKIAPLVESQNAVLAVGAAHLSGESGVLRALERMGYTISPM